MSDLQTLRQKILEQNEIEVDLKMNYDVTFSSLTGNLPVNSKISGEIAGIPIDLSLSYTRIMQQPVNTRVKGYVGTTPVSSELKNQLTFSSTAGNIPINYKLIINGHQNTYSLNIPTTKHIGSSRLGGSTAKSKKVSGGGDPKYVGGKLKDPDESSGGTGIRQDTGIPIPSGIVGVLDDIEIDILFQYTYHFDCSSGKTPVNNRAVGFLRKAVPATAVNSQQLS